MSKLYKEKIKRGRKANAQICKSFTRMVRYQISSTYGSTSYTLLVLYSPIFDRDERKKTPVNRCLNHGEYRN